MKQEGMALITILMMVALGTILVAGIAKHQTSTREQTARLMTQNQALLYAKSAETFFMQLLKDDLEHSPDIDHLNENWAQPMPAFPIENGMVSGRLIDESGKFNLNSLVNADDSVNEAAKLWFEQLLLRLDFPVQLSEAVIDWQDQNDEMMGSMGAESNYYGTLNPSYLPPNSKFTDVQELKKIRGLENGAHLKLLPYVSAMPNAQMKVNINTAPALVLAALDDSIDVDQLDTLLKHRTKSFENFSHIDELWSLPMFETSKNRSLFTPLLGVQSRYFKAQIEIIFAQRKRQMTSDLVRTDKEVHVLSRTLAPF